MHVCKLRNSTIVSNLFSRQTQHYVTALSTVATVLAPSVRDVLFTSITYLCLCFIKVIVLTPFSVCFSIIAAYLSFVLSCICVLLVTAMHA